VRSEFIAGIVSSDTSSGGTYSGEVSFTSNDSDENPFHFTVSGSVSTVQIRDDAQAGFSTVGSWTPYAGQGYQSGVHYTAAGDGSRVASWTFTVTPGQYRVAATWVSHSNRASNAPYTLLDGSRVLGSARINQELAPADFSDAGVDWKDLGGVVSVIGNTLVVQLSNDANEYVIADAIRIERVGD
jgi:hypothetical protein